MPTIVGQLLVLVATALQPASTTWVGKAEAPIDGDTLRIRDENDKLHKVRIQGIESPEDGQPFFKAARDHLGKVTKGRDLQVTELGKDSTGYTLATIRINGQDLRIDILAAGMAWHQRSVVDDPVLEAEEREAKARHLGLWVDTDPVAPWEWRDGEEKRKKGRKKSPRKSPLDGPPEGLPAAPSAPASPGS
jgi:endonuclease YncB( thermonuclease family)